MCDVHFFFQIVEVLFWAQKYTKTSFLKGFCVGFYQGQVGSYEGWFMSTEVSRQIRKYDQNTILSGCKYAEKNADNLGVLH